MLAPSAKLCKARGFSKHPLAHPHSASNRKPRGLAVTRPAKGRNPRLCTYSLTSFAAGVKSNRARPLHHPDKGLEDVHRRPESLDTINNARERTPTGAAGTSRRSEIAPANKGQRPKKKRHRKHGTPTRPHGSRRTDRTGSRRLTLPATRTTGHMSRSERP